MGVVEGFLFQFRALFSILTYILFPRANWNTQSQALEEFRANAHNQPSAWKSLEKVLWISISAKQNFHIPRQDVWMPVAIRQQEGMANAYVSFYSSELPETI